MKNYIYIFLFILGINQISLAQSYFCQCKSDNDYEKYFEEKLFGKANTNRIVGNKTEFFYDWALGDVVLKNRETVKNKHIRYNGYFDHLLWMRETDYKTAIINRDAVSGFILYDKNNILFAYFKNMKIKNWYSGDTTEIFLQVLAEGYISFYAHRRIKKVSDTGELFQDYIFYLCKNGIYNKIGLNRLSLLHYFSDDKAAIRSIIRKNYLNVKLENDLIKAIELYNKSEGKGS